MLIREEYTISGNSAAIYGGSLTIQISDLHGNFAMSGGALDIDQGALNWNGGGFEDNQATNLAGGIHANSATLQISDVTASTNSSLGGGGGFSLTNSSLTLTNSTLSGQTGKA